MSTDVPPSLSHLVDGNPEKSLVSYLNRPLIVQQGDLASTDVSTTFSYVNCLDLVNTDPMWEDKLKGFVGFKADIEYTLVVNATRFQQGRYMLCFLPQCGARIRSTNLHNAYRNLHSANLTCRTQLHHVELDINCDTTAKLIVPYTSPLTSYPLNNPIASDSYDIGSVRLYPYVAASSTCTYTLWARFVNISFYGAALPQSGRMRKSKSTQEAERDDGGVAPISGTLRKIATAAGELGRIPLLTSFTAPVSFVSDILANTAQIFGWSKPNVLNPQNVILKDRMRYATTYDGSSTATPLSMSVKNELQNVALTTDLDEMSWDYIKTIPAYYNTFTMSTSDEQDAGLREFNLTYTMSVANTFGTQATATYLPCTMPSMFFNKFRGGFVITLKCVKTEFHSGRILFSVIPYCGLEVAPPGYNTDNGAYLHRAVIDIREGNEWSFEVPYQSIVQWRSIGTGQTLANLRFDVLDKLIAPSTVSSSITFLVEISGAADLEYAQPINQSFAPLAPATIQSGCLKFTDTIGAAPTAEQSVMPAAYCMGEKFTSLRQLLKRTNTMSYNVTKPAAAYLNVVPFMWETNVAVAAGGSGTTMSTDMYSLLSSMYGMVRGSVRFGFTTPGDPTDAAKGCLVYSNQCDGLNSYTSIVNTAAVDVLGASTPLYISTTNHHYAEIDSNLVTGYCQFPGYYSAPAASTMDTMCTTFAAYNARYPVADTTAPDVAVSYYGVPQGTNAALPIRSGADDMSFQCFISTTPVMLVVAAGPY